MQITYLCKPKGTKFIEYQNESIMMKRNLILLLLSVAALLPVKADNITVNGTQRSYILYVPKNLGENRPLLISCHGMNQDPDYQKNMLQIESVADTAKFLTVFPYGINKSWDISGNSDINFITALIDKMVTQYKIDRNRVYLSGFSMGGMLTYHAMNKIADKIAAFAPISGYPMQGATANSNVRPIPIIHTHGTSDDVVNFSGVQGSLNAWIKHNGCPTSAKVTQRYRNAAHITRRVWGPGNDGVEVVLMEMANKGHWISNDNGVKTGDEIWRFCSRYSLNKTSPNVSITSPKSGVSYTCFAPKDQVTFPDVDITANADDPNGTIEKVDFFDGNTLIATCTEKPYKATLTGGQTGKHTLKAVATDNDGETSTASVELNFNAPPQALSLSAGFNDAGCIPAGWTTYDSNEKRTGYNNGYSQGCRVLQFTGSQRGLEYGLYFRNINGSHHQGWAKYGLSNTDCTLTLWPGHYTLRYKICNWNRPAFAPVELCIEKRAGGESVVTHTYTPSVNIGNVASNNFGSISQKAFEFDIVEQGEYVVALYTADEEWADCILGQLYLSVNSYETAGIHAQSTMHNEPSTTYDLQGRRIASPQQGLYILHSPGKSTRKIMVK
jgi:poly(3-hydroxybutyrate) depolymerase